MLEGEGYTSVRGMSVLACLAVDGWTYTISKARHGAYHACFMLRVHSMRALPQSATGIHGLLWGMRVPRVITDQCVVPQGDH